MRPCRPGRKLNAVQVATIREWTDVSAADFARTFKVSRQLVQKVRTGEAWPAECKTTYEKRRSA